MSNNKSNLSTNNLKSKTAKMQELKVNDNFNKSSYINTRTVFSIIIVILLSISLIRVLNSGDSISFSSFLEMLRDSPSINMPFRIFKDLTITADWGVFNFLRNFINVLGNITSVAVFISAGLANVLLYLVYFVRYIFV